MAQTRPLTSVSGVPKSASGHWDHPQTFKVGPVTAAFGSKSTKRHKNTHKDYGVNKPPMHFSKFLWGGGESHISRLVKHTTSDPPQYGLLATNKCTCDTSWHPPSTHLMADEALEQPQEELAVITMANQGQGATGRSAGIIVLRSPTSHIQSQITSSQTALPSQLEVHKRPPSTPA